MAKVTFSLRDAPLSLRKNDREGVSYKVMSSDGKLGELVVRAGGVKWFPKHKSKTNYAVRWSDLAKVLEKPAWKRMSDD